MSSTNETKLSSLTQKFITQDTPQKRIEALDQFFLAWNTTDQADHQELRAKNTMHYRQLREHLSKLQAQHQEVTAAAAKRIKEIQEGASGMAHQAD